MLERRSDGVWRADQIEVDASAAVEWRASQRRAQEGELSLLRAVLSDAIACYERGDTDAADWFYGEPVEPVCRFTFAALCEFLELDPRGIRALLPEARQRRKRTAPRPRRARIVSTARR
jgi:hypothetical protein